MSQPLSIRDLLAKGAKPTAEDAANLKRIATFVSRYFAQIGAVLPQARRIGAVGMEPANTRATFAATTAGRWSRPLGSGASMLGGSRLGRHWDTYSGNLRSGYGHGAWDVPFYEQVSVVDEDGEIIFQESAPQNEGRRRQRKSKPKLSR